MGFISQQQVEEAKRVGKGTAMGLKKGKQIVSDKDIVDLGKIQWLFNKSDAVITVPDLRLEMAPKDWIYVSKFYTAKELRQSENLKVAIFDFKDLVVVNDPSEELDSEDFETKPDLVKIGKKTRSEDGLTVPVDIDNNPYIDQGEELDRKEDRMNERLIGKSKRRSS